MQGVKWKALPYPNLGVGTSKRAFKFINFIKHAGGCIVFNEAKCIKRSIEKENKLSF